jgi:glutathione peroxidase-family protein
MKLLFSLLLFALFPVRNAGNFFTLSFTRLDGTVVSTSAYQGKRVIVFAFNGAHPNISILHAMDSIQKANPDSLMVLAFPALEFDSSANVQTVTSVRDSMGLSLIIGQPCSVTKASGSAQIPLFQWLTSIQGNGHFSRDVEEEGMMFIVGKRGTLYSVINAGLYTAILPKVLKVSVVD